MVDANVQDKARELGEICTQKGYKVSVAESMTAGRLADIICSVSGASRYFIGGLVCYDPRTKAFVGVKEDVIAGFGIYSKEVATGLAVGASSKFGSDIGVGITGIAEPDGKNARPGAWIAVSFQGDIEARHVECEEGTLRNEARQYIAQRALELLLDVVRDG